MVVSRQRDFKLNKDSSNWPNINFSFFFMIAEAYLELCETSYMESFVKMINGF